ncbi:MAG: GNAT family N-acetyltransferase [Patescibacteria group bacterium]
MNANLQELQSEIVERGLGLHVRLADSDEDRARVKSLDDVAFGQHHGISLEELGEIHDHGAVVMFEDEQGNVVGETQILFEQIPALGRYKLAKNEAYAYGTAVDPEKQGQGIGRLANESQKVLARAKGKDTLVATVRVENYPSLRLRMKNGFRIAGYDPEFYGPLEEGGARAVIKSTTESVELADKDLGIEFHQVSVFDGQHFDQETYLVPVQFGDLVDVDANEKVRALLTAGYEGVWIIREESKESEQQSRGYLVFRRRQETITE